MHCNLLGRWPSNSPNLNVIEHLWAILKHKVEEVNSPNLDALVDTIKEAWDSISIITINSLVKSFTKRCVLCLKLNGESLNGHFNNDVKVPAKETRESIPAPEGEYDWVIMKKIY